MKILGLETSCDDTAVAVLEVKNHQAVVCSNVISSQVKIHAPYGGVFPSLAAREHAKNIDHVLSLALKKAGLKYCSEIDLLAVTRGPGLMVALLVGLAMAKTLAWKYKKPVAGVNHLEGHILSNWLSPDKTWVKIPQNNQATFPALCLIVSGGHTSLVLMPKTGKYHVVGETRDDAAGEAFDKIARLMGLEYPGGPAIAQWAIPGDPERFPLPRPMLKMNNFDFSFSGLKTAVLYLLKDLAKDRKEINSQTKSDIAASAQKAIVEVLTAKTISAARKYQVKTVTLSGGVSANQLLRATLEEEVARKLPRTKFLKPALNFTTDNAAMIALAGYLNYQAAAKNKKDFTWKSLEAEANLGF